MVHSDWASEFIEDPSQQRHKSGYSKPGMNNVNGMDEVESAKHIKTSNYHAPTGYAPTPAYPSSFLSGGIDSSYTPGNTNTVNTMNNLSSTKNSKKGKYPSSTAAPGTAGYPITFQSDDIDLNSVPPGYPGYSNNTNNVNRVNSMDAAKNGKKSNYHSSTAAPPVAKYPSASLSSEVDSSYTRNNTTSGVKGMNNVNGAKNGNNSNYQALTGTEPLPSCPRAFQPDELYSRSTPTNKNSMNNATKINATKNSKKGNYHSPTAASATAGYPSALLSSDIDSSYTWNNANTVTNTSSVNRTNNTSKGKKGTYGSATAGSDIAAYSSSVQSSDTGSISNSIAAAWEEHIDETTNRKYFYNTITRRSTWGQPSGMVKRPPPPPPSLPPIVAIIHKREQDHWFKMADSRGRRVWYNEITNVSQVDRPDCLRKYK